MEMMQLEDRALCAQVFTVRIDGLSLILGRSQQTVQNQMYREPDKIPPWVEGSNPRIWHLPTVDAWLAERSRRPGQSQALATTQFPRPDVLAQWRPLAKRESQLAAKRRPGRPRKSAVTGGAA